METAAKVNTGSQPKSVASAAKGGKSLPAVPVLQQPGEREQAPMQFVEMAANGVTKFESPAQLSEQENNSTPGLIRYNPVQKKANNTGLPDNLKSGVENLGGYDMSDVKVHYNSAQPAQLNAHAYAQGTDIHIGPGQEKHLPHEAWHVVQQKQGRVRATMQMKGGVPVNDDKGLEHEADVMGANALKGNNSSGTIQAKASSLHLESSRAHGDSTTSTESVMPGENQSALINKSVDGVVSQLVLATVNPQNGPVNLTQVGGGGAFVVMQNPTQADGADVSNAVGFTGVLNADRWAGLGKSPKNYWRAHGYAKSFGGAGDITNVGWWTEGSETNWTEFEQRVRGAGLAQIAEWLPGVGETGTYQVDREMYGAIDFKAKYVTGLMKGVAWGLDNARAAWIRALATCDTIIVPKEREKRLALVTAAKAAMVLAANGRIQTWVNAIFGNGADAVDTNLIKNMQMTYTRTGVGAGAGPGRANLTKKIASEKPNLVLFGLEDKPQDIWVELVNANNGIFAEGNPPAAGMTQSVPYAEARRPAQQLRAYADGWGSA